MTIQRIRDVSRAELKSGMADGSVLVVDVREDCEFAAGAIPGSVSMPLSRFDPIELECFAGRRIVFSCAAGVRSVSAIELCARSGSCLDEHYGGGFRDWAMAGEPVEFPSG